MHDIEPWYGWRDYYIAEEDKKSPFYQRQYDEFVFTNKIYNHFIHPQWDFFGSETLYIKILFVDYQQSFALIECIGEWNDCLENDIMFLKREIIDVLISKKIYHFVLFCDNVLNYHGDEDCYYEEWYDDIKDQEGWICFVNTFDHVLLEMKKYRLHHYVNFGQRLNEMNWRGKNPELMKEEIENIIFNNAKMIKTG
ncbi:MAG: hypothetical protein IPL63_05710 [Saprospiraceae bacterium]|nr:hypothetical protein [Saprospiraceae bacterium]